MKWWIRRRGWIGIFRSGEEGAWSWQPAPDEQYRNLVIMPRYYRLKRIIR